MAAGIPASNATVSGVAFCDGGWAASEHKKQEVAASPSAQPASRRRLDALKPYRNKSGDLPFSHLPPRERFIAKQLLNKYLDRHGGSRLSQPKQALLMACAASNAKRVGDVPGGVACGAEGLASAATARFRAAASARGESLPSTSRATPTPFGLKPHGLPAFDCIWNRGSYARRTRVRRPLKRLELVALKLGVLYRSAGIYGVRPGRTHESSLLGI